MTLVEILNHYYASRGLRYPDFPDAVMFTITELGEALEVWLSKRGYVRNNPGAKPKFSSEELEKELGDVIMMAQVTGMTLSLDPLGALLKKLSKKAKVSYKLSI